MQSIFNRFLLARKENPLYTHLSLAGIALMTSIFIIHLLTDKQHLIFSGISIVFFGVMLWFSVFRPLWQDALSLLLVAYLFSGEHYALAFANDYAFLMYLHFFPIVISMLFGVRDAIMLVLVYVFSVIIHTVFFLDIRPALVAQIAVSIVMTFGFIMAYVTSNRHKEELLSRKSHLEEELKRMDYHVKYDPLTEVPNRHFFNQAYQQTRLRIRNREAHYVLAMVDADYFKKVNDTYGHVVGDQILKQLAQVIKSKLREHDFIGRFGGEEFVLLLEGEAQNVVDALERVRQAVENYSFTQGLKMTVSIGYTQIYMGDTLEKTTERADKALYYVKENGRNNIHFNK